MENPDMYRAWSFTNKNKGLIYDHLWLALIRAVLGCGTKTVVLIGKGKKQ